MVDKMLQKSSLSLLKIRALIARHSQILGIFAAAVLLFSSFAGFLHNHSDDPFHAQSHETCPATVWAYTAFTVLLITGLFLTVRPVLTYIFNSAASFAAEDYFFLKASRAPPAVL